MFPFGCPICSEAIVIWSLWGSFVMMGMVSLSVEVQLLSGNRRSSGYRLMSSAY